MESFWYRYRNPLVLAGLVLLQIVLLASQIRRAVPDSPDGHEVRLARVWTMETVSPFERLFHWIGSGVRNTWGGYVWLRHTRQQNGDLRAEVQRLRLEQAALLEDAQQGQRLQKLLGFKEHYPASLVTAQVIGTSGSEQSRVLYIDKGKDDGLAPDMPVITPDGVVGKIRDVGPRTSQVLEISDQTSGAGIMLERTRIRGVLRGNALGQPEVINMLPDDRIQPGERVLTSGGDQVFPRGLTVGTVERVVPDPERDPYVAILVSPSANLQRLEEVLVITSQADAQPASMAKDIAASQLTATQQRAAEVLAEKLPTVEKTAEPVSAEAEVQKAVATPVAAVHPDIFSSGSVQPASSMTPGEGPKPAEGVVEDAQKKPATKPDSASAAMLPATAEAPKAVTTVHVEDDGTLTVTTKNPDGSKLIVKKREDGTVLSTKKIAAPPAPVTPKPVENAEAKPAAAGAATGAATSPRTAGASTAPADTTANSNVWWANDDGTKTYVTVNADGSKTLTRKAADGTVVSNRKVVPSSPGNPAGTTASTKPPTAGAAVATPKPASTVTPKPPSSSTASTSTKPAAPTPGVTRSPAATSTPRVSAGAVDAGRPATSSAANTQPAQTGAPKTPALHPAQTPSSAATPTSGAKPQVVRSTPQTQTPPKPTGKVSSGDFGVVGDR